MYPESSRKKAWLLRKKNDARRAAVWRIAEERVSWHFAGEARLLIPANSFCGLKEWHRAEKAGNGGFAGGQRRYGMSRRSARENAFFLLFQMDFHKTEEYEQVKEIFFVEKEQPVKEEDRAFIMKEVEGTRDHKEEIDKIIGECAKGWETDRMNKVDLAILRLAVYEIRFSGDTPVGVAINEAVELAKKFSSDEAPSFINGILGKAAKEQA